MARFPRYYSESITAGNRTYQVEARRHSRGQKYLIITQVNLLNDEQRPVIIFDRQIPQFLRILNAAANAVMTSVPEVEDVETRERKKKAQPRRVPANPPEFGNSGKAWTQAHDEQLAKMFEAGESWESIGQSLLRRQGAIEVRLYKLGLLKAKS